MTCISRLGHQYNALQMRMGQEDQQGWQNEIPLLFSPTFKKIANGEVLVEKGSDLLPQIDQCRALAGPWTIQVKAVTPAKNNKSCTIRYVLCSQKAGDFDVIALLDSADGRYIDQIDEVYYHLPSSAAQP
ncbi:MAG: hypothetical protein ACK5TR_06420 [Alphaproteobacteria bacterium]|jgi:hypothetical protein|nr:hypothetical protein [Alphaproteobacteria bacterium]